MIEQDMFFIKIASGKSQGTHLVDELISKIEEKGIIQA